MRMRVPIFTPNAFSIRSAMFPDTSDRPLMNTDRAGRETPSTPAAAATRQAQRCDDLRLHECAGMGRVQHSHRAALDTTNTTE